MKTLLQILFFFCITTLTTYSQWVGQSPKPLGNNLNSVDIINDNIIWTAGDGGALLKSSDGGSTWQRKPVDNKYQIRRVQFLDEQNGYICAREWEYVVGSNESYYGIILETNDGGNNWNLKYRSSTQLTNLFFINQWTGWAIADSGRILKTTNGGDDWAEYYCGYNARLLDIKFLDELNGWMISAYGDGGVFRSTDGGNSWTVYNPMFNTSFYCMSFISESTGWVCSSEMFKTTDGGQSWNQISSTAGTSWWPYIQFVNENVGWCYQNNSMISTSDLLKSTDGGITWTIQNTNVTEGISDADFLNTNFGCAVGAAGTIITTINGGDNWISHTTKLELSLNKVDFPSSNNGYAIGRRGSGLTSTSLIIKSTDGGENWEVSDSLPNSWFLDLHFINESKGWVVGSNFSNSTGFILQTENGGNSWSTQFSYPGLAVTSIDFTDELNGWASFSTGDSLLHSTNGGISWEIIATGNSIKAKEILFINPNTGWVVGYLSPSLSAKIIKTTNGGSSWQDISPQNIYDILYTIDFVSEQTGWVAGEHGKVFRTTNGGLSWTRIWMDNWPAFKSIDFVNENVGWIVTDELFWGYESSLFYTTNGGDNWELKVKIPGSEGSIFMMDQNTGWLVSGHNVFSEPQVGFVYKTTNGGVTFIEEEKKHDVILNEFYLSQNYPNPFNPNTKFTYSVAVSGIVTLKIFDILGSEVLTLVNEEKPAGNYEITWYAANLPSGVYFYRLKAGSFVQTRKMILLK